MEDLVPTNRIEATAQLRTKNQLTLPTPIVNALGAAQFMIRDIVE